MNNVDRWLLPDGIGEILPDEAARIEGLRRKLLDLYSTWGYDMIIPPLLEFTESLLAGNNRDLDLQTFKVTDQVSGRTMGLRADITPQAARMDAHSLGRQSPTRLCYAGSVLHTRRANALASRSPIQIGAECFGIQGLEADVEVISLMCETLQCVRVNDFAVTLGHSGIFRALVAQALLTAGQQDTLFDILQRKASRELEAFMLDQGVAIKSASCFRAMMQLSGDAGIITQARERLREAPATVIKALDELEHVAWQLRQRYTQINVHVDLADLPGFQYHNGMVFAAYAAGVGSPIANGGRYDDVSVLYGRHRPATGFNADLKTLIAIGQCDVQKPRCIRVGMKWDIGQWQEVVRLRAQGDRVIELGEQSLGDTCELGCTHELVYEQGRYVVNALSLNEVKV